MTTHTPGLPVDIDVTEDITDISIINYRGDTVADVTHPPEPELVQETKSLDFLSNIRGVFHS